MEMAEEFYSNLIIKELKGKTTPEESEQLDSWIYESAENQKIYNDIWTAYSLTSPNVTPFNPDKDVAWSRIIQKIGPPAKTGPWIVQFTRIAAAALIFFLIGVGVQYFRTERFSPEFLNQYSTVVVPEGQKSMIVLPDGSHVWINSGSSLKYKGNFNNKIREVEIEGEAFFEVKKDKSKMFRVNAGELNVEVYGTAFNVKNYKDEKKIEVTVENGNVGVFKNSAQMANLKKGEQAVILNENSEVILRDAKVDIVTAWKNNELIFDGSPFEEEIRYLERWYGVNIKIEEKTRKKHNYTFKVKTETLTELLKLLQVITPLQYRIDGKNVTIKYAN